jgi:hypothetical protein
VSIKPNMKHETQQQTDETRKAFYWYANIRHFFIYIDNIELNFCIRCYNNWKKNKLTTFVNGHTPYKCISLRAVIESWISVSWNKSFNLWTTAAQSVHKYGTVVLEVCHLSTLYQLQEFNLPKCHCVQH